MVAPARTDAAKRLKTTKIVGAMMAKAGVEAAGPETMSRLSDMGVKITVLEEWRESLYPSHG